MASELRITDWDYKDLYLSILEATAKICRVPKYHIYTAGELLGEIKSRAEALGDGTVLPDFAERIINSECT